jgi:protein phosphatase
MAGPPPTAHQPQAPVPDGGLPDGWIRAEVAALSACGPVRDQNEDRVGWTVLGDAASVRSPGTDQAVSAQLEGPGIAIMVADGLGGHSHGELASRTAIGRLLRRMSHPDAVSKPGELLRAGFEDANQACLAGDLVDPDSFDRDPVNAEPRTARERRLDMEAAAQTGRGEGEPGTRGGQTTLTAIALTGRSGSVAHVGDTRLFRLRDGMIELLTNDHTQARELLRMRVIKPEQVLTHPGRHLLTRSIGGDLMVRVDERPSPPALGDAYLLCSDGLWSSITSWEAHNALTGDLAAGVADLVARSAAAGGDDNASVIAMRVTALSGGAEPTSPGWRFPWRR